MCDMNTEQVRIGGKCRGAGSEYEIMTTAVQQYLLGHKSGSQRLLLIRWKCFFPVESHCDQCKGEERFILQARLEKREFHAKMRRAVKNKRRKKKKMLA